MKLIKTGILFFVFVSCFGFEAFAQNKTLKAYLSYNTFYSPQQGPYIEVYLTIVGNSVNYEKLKDASLQGTVQVKYTFKNGSDTVKFQKFNLLSPIYKDSSEAKANFFNLQRFTLKDGSYEFDVDIKDTSSRLPAFHSSQIININYPKSTIAISDIELIASMQKRNDKSIMNKNGYEIIPYSSNFYPTSVDSLGFYIEIYNSAEALGKDYTYLVFYYIENYKKQTVVGNYRSFSRQNAAPVNVVSGFFPIKKLPTGNYNLVIELRNQQNKVITSKKIFFQRLNTAITPTETVENYQNTFVNQFNNKDTLAEYIAALAPISSEFEVNFVRNQLEGASLKLQKQYFLNFWLKRNATDPEAAWKAYHKKVEYVNEHYSTQINKGYLTDRGRIYLKFGKPNALTEQKNNPSAYPYEIWQYYKTKKYTNIKYVFYEPDVGTNNYLLLFTNMPGELSDPQWKIRLFQRTTTNRDPYNNEPQKNYGNHVDEYYNLPR